MNNISQNEADFLLRMPKKKENNNEWDIGLAIGNSIRIPLISQDETEGFILDIRRNKINLVKGSLQQRSRGCVVLVRLDYGGPPHRNPDDKEIPSPHIHLYREGWGDKWAYSVDPALFSDTVDHWTTLQDFLRYCNVIDPPNFNRGLFK